MISRSIFRRSSWTITRAWRRFNSTASESTSASKNATSFYWCGQVVFPHRVRQGTVEVRDGEIISCRPGQSREDAELVASRQSAEFVNLGEDSCLSPGLVDVHVHISALGRDWEGYTSATQAAAAGGITTLIGMPLNSNPPTTSPESFSMELETAEESTVFVDVGLWGGVVPGNCNSRDLDKLLQSGVFGLKAFLSPLPPAAGYEAVSPAQLMKAADICGQHDKPILVHSELMTEREVISQTQSAFERVGPRCYQAHLNSRPAEWEQRAVEAVCEAASYCHMHIVHLSDAGCFDMIRSAKDDRDKELTVETCPHYLLMDSSTVQDGDTRVKCFPPIRDANNREELWKGMKLGLIDMVASDHRPCEPELRCRSSGNFREAWGGLTGLQYQLPATWTEASKRNFSVLDMAHWWSRNPCKLAGLDSIKGTIEAGKQADFCWWDPNYIGAPDGYSREYHRWKGDTLYASDSSLQGRVLGTWVKGVKVYDGEVDEHKDAAGSFLVS